MHGRPDTELVVLARQGSSEAAGALFDRYWILAWRTAYAVTADRGLADDAGQEAFVKAFGALSRFDETQPFAPWLKRIASTTLRVAMSTTSMSSTFRSPSGRSYSIRTSGK